MRLRTFVLIPNDCGNGDSPRLHALIRFFAGAVQVALVALGCQGDKSASSDARNALGDTSRIATRSQCLEGGCEIQMVHRAAVSDVGVEGQFRQNLSVSRDSKKRLVVAGWYCVIVYDSTGQLIGTFGDRGQGPGEFGRLNNVMIGPGDSIHAFDIAARRLLVVSPQLKLVRTVPFVRTPSFVLADGSYIVPYQIATPERIGYPLHRVLSDGTVALSFGTEAPQYRPDLRLKLERVAGPGRGGTIWAAAPGRYVLEHFDPTSGKRIDSVRVASKWFEESTDFGDDLRTRPKPIIETVWEDDLGFVWIALRRADAQWYASPPGKLSMSARSSPEDFDAIYDWVIEVLDPTTAQIIASLVLPTYPRFRHPSSSFVTLGPDSTHVTHHVWQLSLKPKEAPKP